MMVVFTFMNEQKNRRTILLNTDYSFKITATVKAH